jgi:hypothetical protein
MDLLERGIICQVEKEHTAKEEVVLKRKNAVVKEEKA